jgi:hypothetical protein
MHGWPDYRTSDLSFLLHALWAASSNDFESLARHGEVLAAILDEDTPLSAAMGNRTGPLGKPVAALSRDADGAFVDAELTGLCCRRRIVYMMPSGGNMWQVPYTWQIKSAQMQLPELWHYGPADCAAKVHAAHQDGWSWWSDDISAYDQSVSDTHQKELIQEVYLPMAGARACEFFRSWKDIPLLGPGLSTNDEGYLYTKQGMTASGDLKTALDGTHINFARVLRCVAAATGQTLAATVAGLRRWWFCLIQGDDTVLGMSKPFSEAVYMDTSAALGYSTKLTNGVVFLMHAINPITGSWAPLTSRVFQQTVFNEYGGQSEAIELFSFIARTPGQFWAVNPWSTLIERLLSDGAPFAKYRTTPMRASEVLRNPAFLTDLEFDLRATSQRAERFKAYGSLAMSRSLLSDAVARLIDDRAEIELPKMQPDEAWLAAQRLATHMAKPLDERKGLAIPSLGQVADAYLDYITTGGQNDTDETE